MVRNYFPTPLEARCVAFLLLSITMACKGCLGEGAVGSGIRLALRWASVDFDDSETGNRPVLRSRQGWLTRMLVVGSKRSLSTLIPMLVMGAGIAFLALYLLVSWSYYTFNCSRISEQRLESMGPRLTEISRRLLSYHDTEALQQEMLAMQQLPDIGLAVVVNEANVILYASDADLLGLPLEATDLAQAVSLIAQSEGAMNGVVDQIDEPQKMIGVFSFRLPDASPGNDTAAAGHVLVSIDLEEAYSAQRVAMLSQALATILLLSAVAGLLWYVLHQILIKPLRRIVATARAIAAGDFSVRTNLASGNELGEISATLDSLALSYSEQAKVQIMQRRLSQMVEDMADEFFVNNAETLEVINTNKAARVKLGYSADEIIGLMPWDFVAGYTPDSMAEYLEPLFNGGQGYMDYESIHIRKDGSTYPVRARMQYMPHQVPPVIVTIARDLSELRIQEENARLRERAMSAVSEGVIITDAGENERTIVYVNPAACEMSGYSAQELLGKSLNVLRRSDTNQAGLLAMKEALMRGESVQVQLDSVRKDGSSYVTDVSMSPVFSPTGELTNFIGIHRDVTQKLETEEKLHQAQKIKAIGHLSGGLAHDFNNLLSVIVGNLELLRAGLDDEAQVARIERAEQAALMGAHLTRRLLSFASQQRLVPVVTNVNDLVRNAMALLAPTIGEAISLNENLALDLWNTLTDPGEVETAVINLTINARDAMPQGGNITIKTANVRLASDDEKLPVGVEPGDYVKLCVRDTGVGISQSVQKRIFEPFFTTKKDKEGSGLGLASVFGFAKQSGGGVRVLSSEGEGTAVSVYLPRYVEIEDDSRSVSSANDKSCHIFQGARILVVEDKEMVRQLTVQQLEVLGFVTQAVDDGVKAISLLETGVEVDVVLSDVVMPGGVSGYDVAAWVRLHRPDCHFLLTSGFNDPSDHGERADIKGLHVLQKPYRLDDLRKALYEAMSCTLVAEAAL